MTFYAAVFNLVYSITLLSAPNWIEINPTMQYVARVNSHVDFWGSFFALFAFLNFSTFAYPNHHTVKSGFALLTACYMMFFGVLATIGAYNVHTTSSTSVMCLTFGLLSFICCIKLSNPNII